ncbi:protein of unknown function [Maridesulfovibrio hydrothermalis AM13 = DSM 14728]|uniref:Uncharacterized protein n=1 Tax=Maridesulfovibrio hydrothermalis AM13 = DSM 14728 TaxID=1121451 RepID=L0RFK2_9BACT|nr:protein of unknown function [Maridesulfovibrio hydrothermalis AM13 = DSM 14728]
MKKVPLSLSLKLAGKLLAKGLTQESRNFWFETNAASISTADREKKSPVT